MSKNGTTSKTLGTANISIRWIGLLKNRIENAIKTSWEIQMSFIEI